MALAVVGLSTVLVVLAGTRPGFDPYGWINWGYQTIHLNLDLGGAPSWKPLPYLFTVPYAVFGHYALWLWMITATSISLSGAIFGGRIAYRLTGTEDGRRWPAIVAAVVGGVAVLGIEDYFHLILSSQSDPMIVSLCLAAIDLHLSGHRRWAFVMAMLACLGRPETWFVAAPYSLWLWRTDPRGRWLLAGGWLAVLFLWFGVPTITNGRPLIAGQLAEGSPRELHEGKIIGTFHRFTELTYLPIQLGAVLAVVLAFLRRRRDVLLIAAAVVVWFLVEEAFVLHGWPGVPRYMFEPAGVTSVLAGVAVGWVLRGFGVLRAGAPRLLAIPVAAVVLAAIVPAAMARVRAENSDLTHEHLRTTTINRLGDAIAALGGAQRIRACGDPVVKVEYVSILAFYTRMNDGDIGHRPAAAEALPSPIVKFTEIHNGWIAFPWHTAPAMRAQCSGLNAMFIYTHHHPAGELRRRDATKP